MTSPQKPTDTVSNETELNLSEPMYPTRMSPAADNRKPSLKLVDNMLVVTNKLVHCQSWLLQAMCMQSIAILCASFESQISNAIL